MPRAFLVAVVMLAVCAPATMAASQQPRIVNGSPADAGEYPAQGFLLIERGGDLFACGGTVVSPLKFLTAAHCVVDENDQPLAPAAFNVFLGEIDTNNFGDANRHFISAVALHPDYAEDAGGHTNDVAVLTFSDPVAAAPTRIVTPGETALWAVGTSARIIGWGTTSNGGSAGSDLLLEANVPIRADIACGAPYGASFVPATMLCAGAASPPRELRHLPG